MNRESRSRLFSLRPVSPFLRWRLLALVCLGFGCAPMLAAQQSLGTVSNQPPNEDRYVYKSVPDIRIQTSGAIGFPMSSLWQSKPLLLTMIFTRCSGVCYPFLSSFKSAVSEAGGPGRDYLVLVLSFDPGDTATDMASMAEGLGLGSNPGWIFGVSSPEEITRLAAATGFWSRWDQRTMQYDHPALVVAIQHGKIVRMLVGATVPKASLAEVVQELRGKFIESYILPGKVAFRCFEYDPNSGRYSLDWGLLLMVFPAMFAIFATVSIFLPSVKLRRELTDS